MQSLFEPADLEDLSKIGRAIVKQLLERGAEVSETEAEEIADHVCMLEHYYRVLLPTDTNEAQDAMIHLIQVHESIAAANFALSILELAHTAAVFEQQMLRIYRLHGVEGQLDLANIQEQQTIMREEIGRLSAADGIVEPRTTEGLH